MSVLDNAVHAAIEAVQFLKNAGVKFVDLIVWILQWGNGGLHFVGGPQVVVGVVGDTPLLFIM
jgi:hypothetical protein